MTIVTSRTTNERILRTLFLSVLVDVFAVMYLWDGYVGYRRQNEVEFAKLLGMPADAVIPVHGDLTADAGRRRAERIKPGESVETIEKEYGAPSVRQPDAVYYLGPGGWLKVETREGRAVRAAWTQAGRSDADQQWQRWIGYALCLAGFFVTLQLARVLGTRATVTDEGLSVTGRPLIPFDAMTELRSPATDRDRVAELVYLRDGQSCVLKLDDYVYRDLPAILAAIRERKGFV